MNDKNRIVAVALLTSENLRTYGSALKKVFPLEPNSTFDELIKAIDAARREDLRKA